MNNNGGNNNNNIIKISACFLSVAFSTNKCFRLMATPINEVVMAQKEKIFAKPSMAVM